VAERVTSFGGLVKKAANKSFKEVYSKACTQAPCRKNINSE